MVAPGYWQLKKRSLRGWRLKTVKRPRFRFQGLEMGSLAEANGLHQALRLRRRWLKANTSRFQERFHPHRPRRLPLIQGRRLPWEALLAPRPRWGQRLALRKLRHPRLALPRILVPLESTLRYRRARMKVYNYMLHLWEDGTDHSQATVGMADFIDELGFDDPASYP